MLITTAVAFAQYGRMVSKLVPCIIFLLDRHEPLPNHMKIWFDMNRTLLMDLQLLA
jgi:hypothetical protein